MVPNQVLLGDCLDLMKTIPDGSVDMILSDLPYGTTKNQWDKIIDLEAFWKEANRVIKDNGAVVLFAQAHFDKILAMFNIKNFRYEWIWEKSSATGHLNAKRMPMKAHENILVFYKKMPVYNPIKTTGHVRKVSTADHKRNSKLSTNYGKSEAKSYDSTERYPRSVLKFKSDKQKSALFPTQKPVALGEYLIKTYTNPGETVLDMCCGSGSFGVSCVNTGRNYILMDNDPESVKMSRERINVAKFNLQAAAQIHYGSPAAEVVKL